MGRGEKISLTGPQRQVVNSIRAGGQLVYNTLNCHAWWIQSIDGQVERVREDTVYALFRKDILSIHSNEFPTRTYKLKE